MVKYLHLQYWNKYLLERGVITRKEYKETAVKSRTLIFYGELRKRRAGNKNEKYCKSYFTLLFGKKISSVSFPKL